MSYHTRQRLAHDPLKIAASGGTSGHKVKHISRKLLAVNQSTGPLFRSVAHAFAAAGVDTTLLTGHLEQGPDSSAPFKVILGRKLEKAPAWRRIWTWGLFTLQTLWQMAQHRDHFALLVSNPPLVPWLGPIGRRLFNIRYAVLVYDVYPDVMVRMGMIRDGGLIHRFMARLSRESYRHADVVITVGPRMGDLVQVLMPTGGKGVEVIPNWADTQFIRPIPKGSNPFAAEHDLTDKLVIMYSGAFGATHDIETMIDAAELVQDLDDVCFVLIGGGTREKEVRAYAGRKKLPNLKLLDWQPLENTRYSLTAADMHIISLDAAYEGISIPSKTYSSLAAGAAIICISGPGCEVAELLDGHACGIRVDPKDAEALAAAIRRLRADRTELAQMQGNARRTAEARYSSDVCLKQYKNALLPLLR